MPQTCLKLTWFKSYIVCLLCACAHNKRAQMHVRLLEWFRWIQHPKKILFRLFKLVCSSFGSKVMDFLSIISFYGVFEVARSPKVPFRAKSSAIVIVYILSFASNFGRVQKRVQTYFREISQVFS